MIDILIRSQNCSVLCAILIFENVVTRNPGRTETCKIYVHSSPWTSRILSGVSLSLLSRIMSPRLSRGTFNCGLLSTEAGTFARVVGDGLITVTGYLGTAYVLNLTMLPVLLSVLIALGLFRAHYTAMY